MNDPLKTLQNLQAKKQHNAIQLINRAIHQKYDSTDLFLVAFIALFESRGMRMSIDALLEEQKASEENRKAIASKHLKEMMDYLDSESGED